MLKLNNRTVTTGRIWNLPDASIRPKVVSSLWRIFFEGLARFARGRCARGPLGSALEILRVVSP